MERSPADMHFVELLLGTQVLVEYLAGPSIEGEEDWKKLEEGGYLSSQPEARTRMLWLVGYSHFGIEALSEPEGGSEVFLSWSSVLRMYGLSRVELEQFQNESQTASQQEDLEPNEGT